MHITDVRAVPLSDPVPEEKRHRTDLGTKVKTDATLVFVESDDGSTGVGASLGNPPTITSIVEHELAPLLLDEDPLYTERLWEKMYDGSRWKPSLERGYSQPREDRRGVTLEAISGLDIALWDLKGKLLDQPVYKLLGPVRDDIRAYASGGWAPGDAAEAELRGYAEKGFDAVKMRVVGEDDFAIEHTVRRVEAARRGIGDDVDLMVDAHGCLDVSTAIRLADALEPYDISWFEEPVSPDDHAGLAEVRRATTIPIATGEREFTRFDFLSLFEERALDVAQPDVSRAGGFTEIRRIAAMASARGLRVAPHAWGSGVLFAASIHLAMATPNCHVLEVSQGHMPLMYDIFEEEFDVRDGRVQAPERPGLGFTLREDYDERFSYVDGPEYVF
ncbi:mandelate racemase/muconate lactonizing enzyme family protein [Halorarum halophilum]|uniref:Mandelate racemase/muconate lactonizing enzyme family protein n=1 Tax=Halorarum halophilum TaxID=2743090 RepID=A0A7D5KM06_9EURY|nr:mandelate racemase/muconate lactonizing enzyme family protein [Halobaculum halophilum]QLG27302.1 mandelate racemase/muconate lactonizing enzyme family protein [Halobaculum halophilum]